jgi:GNAT superfamily N-acetyltransferase
VPSVTIRAATADDLAAMRSVGERTWPPTYAFAGDDYVAHGLATWWSDEALRASLADTELLVAERDGELLGVGNIDFRSDPPVIWKLYVVPEAQGTGAGSALLAALIEKARGRAREVRLEYVDGNDRAAAFYTAQGFRETGREPATEPGWPDFVWVSRPVA